ncbi:MAG: zinc ribbon domain-containing protein [Clostridia bacterium]|nr:zinc ribbon domain-containing protein [Clostridia bacterium]
MKKIIHLPDHCAKCGQILRELWNFCPSCQSKIDTYSCVFCGKKLKVHWNFCPQCQNKTTGQSFDNGNEWLKTILTAPPRG